MIELSQISNAASFGSTHYLVAPLGNGMSHWVLSGIVDLSHRVKGWGANWRHENLILTLAIPGIGDQYLRVQQWAPFVTLNAVSNDGQSVNAGWDVESFQLIETGTHDVPVREGSLLREASIACAVNVRDIDGYVLRLGYTLHLMGLLEEQQQLG